MHTYFILTQLWKDCTTLTPFQVLISTHPANTLYLHIPDKWRWRERKGTLCYPRASFPPYRHFLMGVGVGIGACALCAHMWSPEEISGITHLLRDGVSTIRLD